jgi:type IV pilus assembly protein PilW
MKRRLRPLSAPRRGRAAGFTLVELMVSIAIALFMVAAVLSIYLTMKSTFVSQDDLAELQDSERLVLTMFSKTVQSAGYFVLPLANTEASALPAATVTRADGSSASFTVGQSIVGSGDGSGTGADSDTVAVRYQTASGDGLMNCQGAANTSGSATVWVNAFAVNASNELTCTVGTGAAVPLVGNVGKLSVLYGVDTDGDGNMDSYLPASGVAAAGLWANVHSVQITVSFLDTTQPPAAGTVLLPNAFVQNIDLMNRQ